MRKFCLVAFCYVEFCVFCEKNVSDWSGVEAFGGLGNFVLELLFLSYQCFFSCGWVSTRLIDS